MNKKEAIRLCQERINEVKQAVTVLKTSDKKSASTQLYQKRKEIKSLTVISELLSLITTDEIKLKSNDDFISLTNLSAERKVYEAVVINEGDALLDILKKYTDRKDIYNKVMNAAEKNGLILDASSNKFVRR